MCPGDFTGSLSELGFFSGPPISSELEVFPGAFNIPKHVFPKSQLFERKAVRLVLQMKGNCLTGEEMLRSRGETNTTCANANLLKY